MKDIDLKIYTLLEEAGYEPSEENLEIIKEASTGLKRAIKNENNEIADYLDGKAIARVTDADERARLIALKRLENKGKLGNRKPVSDELERKEKQAQTNYDIKAGKYYNKKYSLKEDYELYALLDENDFIPSEENLTVLKEYLYEYSLTEGDDALAKLKADLADAKKFANFLKNDRKNINKGSNYDSEEEWSEAVDNNNNKIKELENKIANYNK